MVVTECEGGSFWVAEGLGGDCFWVVKGFEGGCFWVFSKSSAQAFGTDAFGTDAQSSSSTKLLRRAVCPSLAATSVAKIFTRRELMYLVERA